MYKSFVKRLVDVLVSVSILIVFSPLFLILALLVRIKLGGPVIFSQVRPGLHGRLFTLHKFRTMTDQKGSDGQLLPDSQRLTSFGRFLRSTSLDELPELLNVLKGEMSLVGPRPLLVEYIERYSPEQMRRHDVLPGITGLAQVDGRNAISWEHKFLKDIWYVENLSFFLDCKILLKTILKTIRRDGITQPGEATVQKFMGTHT